MLECELKFRVKDFDEVEESLVDLGCSLSEPDEETNLVFDTPRGALGASGTLLRLRKCSAGLLLTVKTTVAHPAVKVREEHEALLGCDIGGGVEILAALGFAPVYRYDKTRRICSLPDTTVCLDELRFGRYVEIEAPSEEALVRTAVRLGFDPAAGIRLSYAALEREADGDA
jgi:adenylate cyclase class 2